MLRIAGAVASAYGRIDHLHDNWQTARHQTLLDPTKIDSAVRYVGVGVKDASELAEHVEV